MGKTMHKERRKIMNKQEKYNRLQVDRGYKKVQLWIPKVFVEKLKTYANKLKEEWKKRRNI